MSPAGSMRLYLFGRFGVLGKDVWRMALVPPAMAGIYLLLCWVGALMAGSTVSGNGDVARVMCLILVYIMGLALASEPEEWLLLDRLPHGRGAVLVQKLLASLLIIVTSFVFLVIVDSLLAGEDRLFYIAVSGEIDGLHLLPMLTVIYITGIGVGAVFGHATVAAAAGAISLFALHIASTMTAGFIPEVPSEVRRFLFFTPWVFVMFLVTVSWMRHRREDMQYMYAPKSLPALSIGAISREITPMIIAGVMIIGAAALAGQDRGRGFFLLVWLLPIGWILLISDREERDGLRFFAETLPIHPARREWLRLRWHLAVGLLIGLVAGYIMTIHPRLNVRAGVDHWMPVYSALVVSSALVLTRMCHFLSGPRALAIIMALAVVGLWNILLSLAFNFITGQSEHLNFYTSVTLFWFLIIGLLLPLAVHLFVHFAMAIRQLADGLRLLVALVLFPVLMTWGLLLLNFSPMDIIEYLFS
ncbi:MAG: hypothetical protein JJU11_16570 [Candidatus Sumerlaeia bacterium]|nr:hypothetical protein [Candidatus Sumerlaeia bacterium]